MTFTTLRILTLCLCTIVVTACTNVPIPLSDPNDAPLNEPLLPAQDMATPIHHTSLDNIPMLDPTTLQPYLWNNRLLLIFARSTAEPAYLKQLQAYDELSHELLDRDMIWFHIFDANADSASELVPSYVEEGQHPFAKVPHEFAAQLRSRYNPDDAAFRVVLIGKDGGVKYDTTELFGPNTLFPIIDAMPMRQQEMRQSNP